MLPAGSVAVVRSVTEESSGTAIARPGEASAAADPVVRTVPVHGVAPYNLTVVPASAVPVIRGALSFAGDAGTELDNCTAAGATVSEVHARTASEGSTLPFVSIALTANVCGPSGRLISEYGEEQGCQLPASRRHWKVEFGFVDSKLKLAALESTRAAGPAVIVVSGSESVVNDQVLVNGCAGPMPPCVVVLALTLAV